MTTPLEANFCFTIMRSSYERDAPLDIVCLFCVERHNRTYIFQDLYIIHVTLLKWTQTCPPRRAYRRSACSVLSYARRQLRPMPSSPMQESLSS
jgi:hypothetical protein